MCHRLGPNLNLQFSAQCFSANANANADELRLTSRTSCALNLQDALLPPFALECADERGSHGEDGPLPVRGRGCLCAGWRRGIDDVLVASRDVWAIAGRVQRGHGGG